MKMKLKVILCFQPGQIIDIRSMINEATRMNAEEGTDGGVSHWKNKHSVSCLT